MKHPQFDIENQILICRLIRDYLSSADKSVWTIEEDACASARTVANRYGVPPDAQTKRYLIEHPDQGWSLSVRAVWRNGKLLEPVGVHVALERYHDTGTNSAALTRSASQ